MIGVIGASIATSRDLENAFAIGKLIAQLGCALICGGLGGVMEAAARGAKEAGGLTIGVIPGYSKSDANPYIDVPIATGLGHARNVIIAATSDALVAVGGEYGTLSEIAFSLKMGKPVISLFSWDIPGVIKAGDPEEAFALLKEVLSC
ncbi:MAG: TIGR00725 family protein [Deferribacteres bacterium]|nr:TIGR00725 family protein [Deferribacteres bacterium]